MLRGIDSNRIIVGAYVDPSSGGICPMLAAHRNGGRTDVAAFARAWDEYTDAAPAAARDQARGRAPSGPCSSRASTSTPSLDHVSIAELAAQIRAERRQRAGHVEIRRRPDRRRPSPTTRRSASAAAAPQADLLTATERELSSQLARAASAQTSKHLARAA